MILEQSKRGVVPCGLMVADFSAVFFARVEASLKEIELVAKPKRFRQNAQRIQHSSSARDFCVAGPPTRSSITRPYFVFNASNLWAWE